MKLLIDSKFCCLSLSFRIFLPVFKTRAIEGLPRYIDLHNSSLIRFTFSFLYQILKISCGLRLKIVKSAHSAVTSSFKICQHGKRKSYFKRDLLSLQIRKSLKGYEKARTHLDSRHESPVYAPRYMICHSNKAKATRKQNK